MSDQVEGASFEYRLQKTPIGIIMLDGARCVRAACGLALTLFGSAEAIYGKDIVALHPPAAQDRVAWLIAQALGAPGGDASMIVATRMGNLLARIAVLRGATRDDLAFCMMFFNLGAMGAPQQPEPEGGKEFLLKLPIQKGPASLVTLVDVDAVAALTAQGHYAEATTLAFTAFCPRSLASLEQRLDPALFMRVHRRHLVNVRHIRAAERIDGQMVLLLADKAATRIPVGRGKVEKLRRLLAVRFRSCSHIVVHARRLRAGPWRLNAPPHGVQWRNLP